MRKINNKKFALNLLIVSFLSILIVGLFVKFILSRNDSALFMVRLFTMLLTAVMILTFLIYTIIFLVRLVFKKKNHFGRDLSIVSAVTIIMVLSTGIMLKEESKYYHTINMNWKTNLPREYTELYHKDSGASFLGDGERYCIFQYKSLDEISNALEWKTKDADINLSVTKILESLEVPKEYYPDFNDNFKYYHKKKEDGSRLYIILNSTFKKAYIVEAIQ